MIRVNVQLRSSSPLLMNPLTDEQLDGLFRGAAGRRAARRDISYEEVCEAKVYKDENGNPAIPVQNLFACLVEAGRLVKFDGKRGISNGDSTLLPLFLSIVNEGMYLPLVESSDWVVDKRRGVNPATKAAACLIRPRFDRWGLDVTIEIDETELDESKVRDLFDRAGRAVGLGDFRPNKKGPFGTFKIHSWIVTERTAPVIVDEQKPATNGRSKAKAEDIVSVS